MYMVVFLGFIYVPYIQHYPNGMQKFTGHHLRVRLFEDLLWEKNTWGHMTIDANLIIAEIIAVTAVVAAIFLLLKKE